MISTNSDTAKSQSARHRKGAELHAAEAEKNAFGISTTYGRVWKKAYKQARRCHTVSKAVEIADAEALRERGGKK